MKISTRSLTLALSMALLPALGGWALAQETAPAAEATTTPEAPAEAPAAEAPANDGPGAIYVAATFTDWQQECVRTADGSDPCRMYQLVKDAGGTPTAEILIVDIPEGEDAKAFATVIAPLGTLLPKGLSLRIDDSKAENFPFIECVDRGCVARVLFDADGLAALKKGNSAFITLEATSAPDKPLTLEVSLKGFTAGFDAVKAANNK